MLDGLKPVFLEALRFVDAKIRPALVEQWNKECQAVYEYKKQLIAEEHYKAAHNGSGWISVEERLPNEDDEVLIYSSYYHRIRVGAHLPSYIKYCNNSDRITHWMPIPEAPKGGAVNE